jgi:hypothetical protein
MPKSTSMLPTLAGGSGVTAHALTDSDLMKVVDATTLNANRDRQMTLAELKAFVDAGGLATEITNRQNADTALSNRITVTENVLFGHTYTSDGAGNQPGANPSNFLVASLTIPTNMGAWAFEVSGLWRVTTGTGGAFDPTITLGVNGSAITMVSSFGVKIGANAATQANIPPQLVVLPPGNASSTINLFLSAPASSLGTGGVSAYRLYARMVSYAGGI